jgi:hypothetical protein
MNEARPKVIFIPAEWRNEDAEFDGEGAAPEDAPEGLPEDADVVGEVAVGAEDVKLVVTLPDSTSVVVAVPVVDGTGRLGPVIGIGVVMRDVSSVTDVAFPPELEAPELFPVILVMANVGLVLPESPNRTTI